MSKEPTPTKKPASAEKKVAKTPKRNEDSSTAATDTPSKSAKSSAKKKSSEKKSKSPKTSKSASKQVHDTAANGELPEELTARASEAKEASNPTNGTSKLKDAGDKFTSTTKSLGGGLASALGGSTSNAQPNVDEYANEAKDKSQQARDEALQRAEKLGKYSSLPDDVKKAAPSLFGQASQAGDSDADTADSQDANTQPSDIANKVSSPASDLKSAADGKGGFGLSSLMSKVTAGANMSEMLRKYTSSSGTGSELMKRAQQPGGLNGLSIDAKGEVIDAEGKSLGAAPGPLQDYKNMSIDTDGNVLDQSGNKLGTAKDLTSTVLGGGEAGADRAAQTADSKRIGTVNGVHVHPQEEDAPGSRGTDAPKPLSVNAGNVNITVQASRTGVTLQISVPKEEGSDGGVSIGV